MNSDLKVALDMLEREREISREALFEAIKNSLVTACRNHFKSADNVRVEIDEDTFEFHVIATKEVIELAVKGMLPKGPLGREMYKKLFVYAGPEHKHAAQKPEELTF